jgi:hypothetical protein
MLIRYQTFQSKCDPGTVVYSCGVIDDSIEEDDNLDVRARAMPCVMRSLLGEHIVQVIMHIIID